MHRGATLFLLICTVVLFIGCEYKSEPAGPQDKSSTVMKAEKYIEEGKAEEAMQVLQRALEGGEQVNVQFHLAMFDAAQALNMKELAKKHMFKALQEIYSLQQKGTFDASKFPKLVRQIKDYTWILFPIHETQWGRRGYTSAEVGFGQEEVMAATFASAVLQGIDPNEGYIGLIRFFAWLVQGEYGRAYTMLLGYTKSYQDDPWGWKWLGDMMRETAEWQPDKNRRLKYYNRAYNHYRKAIDMDGDIPCFYLSYAIALLRRSEVAEASAELQKALDVDPNYAPVHYELANIQYDGGFKAAALKSYTKCIEAAPEFPEPYFQRAYIYFSYGEIGGIRSGENTMEALECYQRASDDLSKLATLIDYAPDVWILNGDCMSRSALRKMRVGLFEPNYDPTTKPGFDEAEPYIKKAIEYYSKAIELDPENHNAYFRRGDAYGVYAKWEECYEDLRKATELGPKEDGQYWRYWYTLGKYLQWNNNHEEAFDAIEQAFKNFIYLCKYEAKQEGRIESMDEKITLTGAQRGEVQCMSANWNFSVRFMKNEDRAKYIQRWADLLKEAGITLRTGR
ncbi:MAG: tetratricopeptide repeat protein [Planctomycetota bacterium]|nr:tetratricopeptide repeat protein [Planctomycetota bacterium]